MPDTLIKTLGALGLGIACASLYWKIRIYRDARKPKVNASLSVGARIDIPNLALFAQIWNSGRVPVYLDAVELAWGDEEPVIGNSVCMVPLTPNPPLTGPLEVGEGHEFVLIPPGGNLLKNAIGQPESKVWLSVRVPGSEILRIDGHTVRPLLVSLAESMNA